MWTTDMNLFYIHKDMYTKGHYVLIFHTLLLSKKINIQIFKPS